MKILHSKLFQGEYLFHGGSTYLLLNKYWGSSYFPVNNYWGVLFTREYLLTVTPDNSSKNSILKWVLKLNLVQRNFFNPNTIKNMSFCCLITHWILHIARISPASWLKIFVFIKFRGCFLICGSVLNPLADL